MYAKGIKTLKTNKQVIADLFWDKLQKQRYGY